MAFSESKPSPAEMGLGQETAPARPDNLPEKSPDQPEGEPEADFAEAETFLPEPEKKPDTALDHIRDRAAEKLGHKERAVEKLDADSLEKERDALIEMLEQFPEQADRIDLASLEFEISDQYPEAKAGQDKLREQVRYIGTRLFQKNPEAFARAFGKGTPDLIPRDQRINIAALSVQTEGSGWTPEQLASKGILTPEEAIGVIESLPEDQRDAEMAKVFQAEAGEPLHELRESLEKMGEFNQANIDFLKQLQQADPDNPAIKKRLENLMDLQDQEPDSLVPLGKGINAAQMAVSETWAKKGLEERPKDEEGKTLPYQSIRKPRISESAYGTEYRSVRLKAEPGKSADVENLGQNFAFMMGIKAPEVALQSGTQGTESAQRFEPGAKMAADIPNMKERMLNDAEFRQQVQLMAALDYVISNSDRHLGNYMETADGEMMSIDTGLAFCDDRLDMDEVKGQLSRELGLGDKFDDVPFDEMDENDREALIEYGADRIRYDGLNSHPLELVRSTGRNRFDQEVMTAVGQVKEAMDAGKDGPLYKMFELTFGDSAEKQWNRTQERVAALIDSDGEVPRNAQVFEGMWQEYMAGADKDIGKAETAMEGFEENTPLDRGEEATADARPPRDVTELDTLMDQGERATVGLRPPKLDAESDTQTDRGEDTTVDLPSPEKPQ
ncbi:hypothetical protein ACFL26_00540 [Patescibacteria group bacterium]